MTRKAGVALGALAALLAFVIYLPGLSGPFLYDDVRQIVYNDALHDLCSPGDVVFNGLRQIRVWQNLSFALNWSLTPGEAWSFKALNILLHIVSSGLLLLFLHRALPSRPRVAILCAALFLVMPLQVGAVTYVMGRVSLIQACFYFLVLVLVSARHERQWLVALVIALAQLGKESCVLLPAAIALYDVTIRGRGWRAVFSRRMALYAAAALLVLPAWWLLRDPVSMYRGTSGFDLYPYGDYLIAQLHYYGFYPYLALNPAAQAIVHPYPEVDGRVVVLAFAGALVCLALVAGAMRARARLPIVTFAVGFFFLSMAPTSSFVQMSNPFAEYRLYQANLLWALLIALGLLSLDRWVGRRVVVGVAVAVCSTFAVLTAFQSYVYADGLRVYARALASYPRSAELHVLVGSQYEQRGVLELAESHYTRAVELEPYQPVRSFRARVRLARLYVATARPREACEQLDAVDVGRFRYGPPPRDYFVLRLHCLSALERRAQAAETLRAGEELYGAGAFDDVLSRLPPVR